MATDWARAYAESEWDKAVEALGSVDAALAFFAVKTKEEAIAFLEDEFEAS